MPLKIVFITGSLEPGRDGVGDYTRRLAAELVRQGHQCRIVSLNDKCRPNAEILKPETLRGGEPKTENERIASSELSSLKSQASSFTEWQESEGTKVECLRLPSSLPWKKRVKLAREWLEKFNPDWVSLQFVPFGFHPKGLCFGLEKHLKAIIGECPLHWMFHELWVIWDFPFRKRLLGQVQKIWFRLALRKLAPPAIATQLPLYQAELRKLGVSAALIPLHGNIPVHPPENATQWLADRSGLALSGNVTKVGFFGHLNYTLNFSLFRVELSSLTRQNGRLVVFSAGKMTPQSQLLWDSLTDEFNPLADFIKFGELNEQEASWYFSVLDCGLTAYAPELMGKSGSVAAMREHGLPVVSCGSMEKNFKLSGKYNESNDLQDEVHTVTQSAALLLAQLTATNNQRLHVF